MRKIWLISVYASVVYLVLLYVSLKWMQKREPFNLRLSLAAWSGALCAFSFFGTVAVWPEFISVARSKGFVATYCDNSYREDNKLVFWYTLFVLSKLAELFDTAFIVLRKQKLITLHCKLSFLWLSLFHVITQSICTHSGVHHVLTLVYCFYVYRDEVSTARWMVSEYLLCFYSLTFLIFFRLPWTLEFIPLCMAITV